MYDEEELTVPVSGEWIIESVYEVLAPSYD
jgi:hypothetical protein